MQYTTFGRTGLRVSVAGLGTGGFSRLGLSTGKTAAQAADLVRAALDLGVNFIDTAAPYGTEAVVGQAIAGREGVVVATKATVFRAGAPVPVPEVTASLETSLRLLGRERIDLFQLHAVPPSGYAHVRDVVLPAVLREQERVLREQERGKVGFVGITETSANDPEHAMLAAALPDGVWDSVMVAFHMMCQNARRSVFPAARAAGAGTLLMFAVRAMFARPALLGATMRRLAEAGAVPAWLAERDAPLDFLVHPGGASSLTDAAYRYARHEQGVDVVLFGTGEIGHLRANVESILKPPLPEPDRARIGELFGHLVGVGLDSPAPGGS